MRRRRLCHSIFVLCGLFAVLAVPAFAQFTASIQGIVQDQSGADVPNAKVELVNTATGATAATTSDASGNYRFVSLAPGNYRITIQAPSFAKAEATVTLLTEQNLNLPISLKVGSASES